MMPFYGKAHVAYSPIERVVGLSKLARLVDVFAMRLQTQEHMTSQIATAIKEILSPRGVAVMIEAEHMCMSIRGVEKPGALTVTTQFPEASATPGRSGPLHDHGAGGPALRPAACGRSRAPAGRSQPTRRSVTNRSDVFATPGSTEEVEEGRAFAPKFDADGLVTCVATDAATGDVLMVAHMNAEALSEDHRDRRGLVLQPVSQVAVEKGRELGPRPARASRCGSTAIRMRVWIKVEQTGAGACHTGRRSCFLSRGAARRRAGRRHAGIPRRRAGRSIRGGLREEVKAVHPVAQGGDSESPGAVEL